MQLAAQYLAEIVEAALSAESEGTGTEKRRHSRIEIVTRIQVLNHTSGHTYTALTRDISREGIAIIQAAPASRGQQITVRLPRGAKLPALAIQCTVMRARELADGLWGIGLLFVAVMDCGAADTREADRVASRMFS